MTTKEALAQASRALGARDRGLVIIAEGNTSLAVGDGTFWVKASGVQMRDATADDFVRLAAEPLLALLDRKEVGETELREETAAAVVEGDRRPSIEAIFHALCTFEFGAGAAAHSHPNAVNGLMCSVDARLAAEGILFPDQAVVLGVPTAFVEYHAPGIALARALRREIRRHVDEWGERPRTVWLRNHGVLALGESLSDAVHITEMADKFAGILLRTFAAGGPNWLPLAHAFELVGREDEQVRRAMLAGR